MPCFHWLFTKRQMSIRTAEVRPYYFFLCFGRGTSVARRDHGGGLALPESCRGYCRSRYDAEITGNRQWRQRITEDLPDASKMYDWNGLLSSSLLLFPQRFGRNVLRSSSGICWTQEPSRNFELRPLLNPWGSPVLIPLAITGYKCLSIPVLLLACCQDWTSNLQMIVSLEA